MATQRRLLESRLERYDVEFDLPEAFLPEFPPAMYLQSRPELDDVSRGEVVSINNHYRLFVGILTAVQLDGLNYSDAGYLRAVEAAFENWEAMQKAGR
jgi:hypothetical protein